VSSAPDERSAPMLAVSEVLLAVVSFAAMLGATRLFLSGQWSRQLLVTTIVAHITVTAVRRLGRGLVVATLVSVVALALQVTITHYRDTATGFLPTNATRDALDADLTAAWNLFDEVKAPTEAVVGFVVLATIAIWLVAFLADWAAFRLASSFEALLPSFAVVVFIAFFGTETHRFGTTAAYLMAMFAFFLAHRLWRQARSAHWLADNASSGTRALARGGVGLIIAAVLGGLVIGPLLPGASEEALIDLDERSDGPGTRVVVSPIVDIRGRLVDQADVEVFTVQSPVASYWRLASLDRFNGTVWGADTRYSSASGPLPDDFPSDATVAAVDQQFAITNLGAVWIPAAFEPRAIIDASTDAISYEPVSGTLIVDRSLENSDGLTYTVSSALPTFDPAALAAAPNAYPPEILDRYLELPEDFSPTATTLARDLTAGLGNDYDRALALQDWFRGNFTYDIDVGPGHSSARIDTFLENRRGYCEQFAGSFAAMARAIGIPARVAVGFTWGDQDPTDPNLWRVRGEHAHAWPEVFIPGAGWVAFEPTPGRGAPGAEVWTNVGPAQEGTGPDAEPLPEPTAEPVPVAPAPADPDVAPTVPTEVATVPTGDGGVPRGLMWVFGTIAAITAMGAAYVATITAVGAWQRSARRRRAGDNRALVQLAWAESVEALRPLGVAPAATETTTEFTRRLATTSPAVNDELRSLDALTVEATYAPGEPDEEAVSTATALRDRIVVGVVSATSRSRRWRSSLDPRPLLRRT
jgi:transglutaminase-like putative cysteine protease